MAIEPGSSVLVSGTTGRYFFVMRFRPAGSGAAAVLTSAAPRDEGRRPRPPAHRVGEDQQQNQPGGDFTASKSRAHRQPPAQRPALRGPVAVRLGVLRVDDERTECSRHAVLASARAQHGSPGRSSLGDLTRAAEGDIGLCSPASAPRPRNARRRTPRGGRGELGLDVARDVDGVRVVESSAPPCSGISIG